MGMGNTSDIFKNSPTFRLFKREPSFADGFASIVDMTPSTERYNQDDTPKEADVNSLKADWQAVGDDLREVIKKYERRSKQTKPSE